MLTNFYINIKYWEIISNFILYAYYSYDHDLSGVGWCLKFKIIIVISYRF
jgi:hypothetical protein